MLLEERHRERTSGVERAQLARAAEGPLEVQVEVEAELEVAARAT